MIAMRHVVPALIVALLGVAFATGVGAGVVTGPIIAALTGAGEGILGPIGIFLGILVTVSIGFAIVRAVRA